MASIIIWLKPNSCLAPTATDLESIKLRKMPKIFPINFNKSEKLGADLDKLFESIKDYW